MAKRVKFRAGAYVRIAGRPADLFRIVTVKGDVARLHLASDQRHPAQPFVIDPVPINTLILENAA